MFKYFYFTIDTEFASLNIILNYNHGVRLDVFTQCVCKYLHDSYEYVMLIYTYYIRYYSFFNNE